MEFSSPLASGAGMMSLWSSPSLKAQYLNVLCILG
jgi:hypothetical protein